LRIADYDNEFNIETSDADLGSVGNNRDSAVI